MIRKFSFNMLGSTLYFYSWMQNPVAVFISQENVNLSTSSIANIKLWFCDSITLSPMNEQDWIILFLHLDHHLAWLDNVAVNNNWVNMLIIRLVSNSYIVSILHLNWKICTAVLFQLYLLCVINKYQVLRLCEHNLLLDFYMCGNYITNQYK